MTATAPTSRFRVHRSTIVVAILLLMFCLILMVPGQFNEDVIPIPFSGNVISVVSRHGWPFVYLTRAAPIEIDSLVEPMFDFPWSNKRAWTDWRAEDGQEFLLFNLLVDFFVLLFIVFGFSCEWERRRRQRKRLLQFKLSELALLCTCIAVVFGWFTYQRNAYREELVQIQNLESLFDATLFPEEQFTAHTESFTPDWMLRFFGWDRCSDFAIRIVIVNYRIPWSTSSDSLTAVIPHLKQLKKMETLELRCFVCGKGDRSLALLAEVPQLRTLIFSYFLVERPFGQAEALELVKVQQLTLLVFKFKVTPEAKQILIQQLPNCEIEFRES